MYKVVKLLCQNVKKKFEKRWRKFDLVRFWILLYLSSKIFLEEVKKVQMRVGDYYIGF